MRRGRLRPRRYVILIGCGVFIVVCVYMYMILESASLTSSSGSSPVDQSHIERLEAKVREMEESLRMNRQTVEEIKRIIRDLSLNGNRTNWHRLYELLDAVDKPAVESNDQRSFSQIIDNSPIQNMNFSAETCQLVDVLVSKSDIQMMDVIDLLPFDNPDGGVWKQGFAISYDVNQWKTQKLKVFVVPHSHNDPGWIKTFERYYEEQTRNILNLMVDKLEAHPQMRFIYAEMSFFSLWWSELNPSMRERVKKLLAENRLEIVTGGWVMTDEATAHYFAMLDQLIEGNQWLINEVGVRPVSGWAIDPFGYSPTMAYLLGQSGIENMLIQRVHYSVKKYLAKNKQLEFNWRQNWDRSGQSDIFCHTMPFYSYDIPHTCGPDPAVCCQFDFKRLPGSRVSCPWKIPPVAIADHNVAERAEILLNQYRQKAQLYKNDVVLIPLGDDFRYDTPGEWDNQFTNYQKLFDYMNSQSDWNVEARFGTLTDYFKALRERAGAAVNSISQSASPGMPKTPPGYPVLSGDFYTYADRDDHYWSGYFTSRPFYKGLDRVVEGHQRAGEILYSLATAAAHHNSVTSFPASELMSRCTDARRHLGLFQHHDGVTGTARDFVVANYGDKLLDAIGDMKKVMMDSAHFLLTGDKSKYSPSVALFDVDDRRDSHDSLPVKTVISLKDGPRTVVFYNSLSRNRTHMVRVHISEPYVEVYDANDHIIVSQVDPFFDDSEISTDKFKLLFVVTIPSFGLARYSIKKAEPNSNPLHSVAKITVYNAPSTAFGKGTGVFELERKDGETGGTFETENRHLAATFSASSGMLQQVKQKDYSSVMKTNVEFVRYGTRPGKERSGAYLFLPDGVAQPIDGKGHPMVRVVRGTLASEVHVMLPVVHHVVRLTDSPGVDGLSLDVLNLVDIRSQSNYELAMRFQTDVANNDELFTDLNGLQMQRRKTYSKLPLNANFYPMTTMAYVQDKSWRLSLLSGQSLGVASLQSGWLEVMQDRRLDQDDNRGLVQPVHDNKLTPNRFRILFERRQSEVKVSTPHPNGFMSLLGQLVSSDLLHPVYVLPVKSDAQALIPSLLGIYQPLSSEPPCSLHIVNLRTIPPGGHIAGSADEQKAALILHRTVSDCSFTVPQSIVSCPAHRHQVSLSSLGVSTAHRSTLTLLSDLGTQDANTDIDLPPMEILAYIVTLR